MPQVMLVDHNRPLAGKGLGPRLISHVLKPAQTGLVSVRTKRMSKVLRVIMQRPSPVREPQHP